jgi:hypothetical protein
MLSIKDVVLCLVLILIIAYFFNIFPFNSFTNSFIENMDYANIGNNSRCNLDSTLSTTGKQHSPQFMLKDNRYRVNNNSNKTNTNCGSSSPYLDPSNMNCMVNLGADNIDWDVKYKSGANNTCSDNLLFSSEPRMQLIDIGMRCGEYNKNVNYVPPVGVPDELLALYDNNIAVPQMEIEQMVGDAILTPDIIPGYTMSAPMTNGIQPMTNDCIAKNVANSYRCNI